MISNLWIADLIRLFFPYNCQACGETLKEQENIICLNCALKLPKTNFHLYDDNPVSRVFWGRVQLEAATSFLFFNKGGNVQKLIHQLKYRGKKEVGIYLGKLFGLALMESQTFRNIDIIIPVPLHPKKQQKRGFNQSESIGKGLSITTGKKLVNDNLLRVVNTDSQTRKSRYSRWENVKDVFQVRYPDNLSEKHILLVDDVLTTGATLEACAANLLEAGNTKVSVVSLAYAQA